MGKDLPLQPKHVAWPRPPEVIAQIVIAQIVIAQIVIARIARTRVATIHCLINPPTLEKKTVLERKKKMAMMAIQNQQYRRR